MTRPVTAMERNALAITLKQVGPEAFLRTAAELIEESVRMPAGTAAASDLRIIASRLRSLTTIDDGG